MIHSVEVYLWGTRVGIASYDFDSVANFEYDKDFINSGIQLSPLYMPLSSKVYSFPSLNKDTFKGLPGLLADSLPDRYGDIIIDSWLASKGRTIDSFTPIERLCYLGNRGMGALEYVPYNGPEYTKDDLIDIDSMVSLASEVLSKRRELHINEKDNNVANLLKFSTSAGGARAKAIIAINKKTGDICSGQLGNQKDYTYWIIKFDDVNNNGDHGKIDSSGYTRVEYAYYLLAINAGIKMNECKILKDNNRYHFMTKRFDREENTGRKIHMQTLGGIAHMDYNIPRCCSYENAAVICKKIGLGNDEINELYRRMVFNVLAINCDDHVKNISFLMDRKGKWSLAPAYDLCFSYRPDSIWVSQHQMSVNNKSKDITINDLLECGKNMNIAYNTCISIIDDVIKAIKNWDEFAKKAQVEEKDISYIGNFLTKSITRK